MGPILPARGACGSRYPARRFSPSTNTADRADGKIRRILFAGAAQVSRRVRLVSISHALGGSCHQSLADTEAFDIAVTAGVWVHRHADRPARGASARRTLGIGIVPLS